MIEVTIFDVEVRSSLTPRDRLPVIDTTIADVDVKA